MRSTRAASALVPPRRLRGDAGAATTELAITAPVLLLMIMAIIQFGLWYHATHVANAAAQEGARAFRIESGNRSEGVATSREFMRRVGGTLFEESSVEAVGNDGDDMVGITVRGRILSVLPLDLGSFRVEATSVGPKESFRGVDG